MANHVIRKRLRGSLEQESLFLKSPLPRDSINTSSKGQSTVSMCAPSLPVFPEEKLKWADSAKPWSGPFPFKPAPSNRNQRTFFFYFLIRLLLFLSACLRFQRCRLSRWPNCVFSIFTRFWAPISCPEHTLHLADWCAEPLSAFSAKNPICLSSVWFRWSQRWLPLIFPSLCLSN